MEEAHEMAQAGTAIEGSDQENKIVREYIPVQKMLEELFNEANQAENSHLRQPHYLTRLYDELTVIAMVKFGGKDEDGFKKLLVEWSQIDAVYGDLDGRRGRLDIKEWRERKRALSRMREMIGMGTSPPDANRNLGPPLPMAAYHECPEDCPILVKLRKARESYS